jgi:hypothetical protein
MLIYIRTTKGLGNSAVYARLRGAGADIGKFWDFVGEAWVTPETADCRQFLTEYADSDTLESLYAKEVTVPTAGRPFTQEAVTVSDGIVIGSDIVNAEAALEASVQEIPTVKFQDGKVYCDTSLTAPGTTYPLGEISSPVDNIADAKTIAAANGLRVIHLDDEVWTEQVIDWGEFIIDGENSKSTFFCMGSGSVPDYAVFKNAILMNEYLPSDGYITAENCGIANLIGGSCNLKNCEIYPLTVHSPNSNSVYDNCSNLSDPQYPFIIDFADSIENGYGPGELLTLFSKWNGFMEVDNMQSWITLNIWSESGVITINASCTAGVINIYYDSKTIVVDNSNGATVNLFAIDTTGLALETSVQSISAKIGAFTGTGWNTILGFFRALMRKDAGVTLPSDIGGNYDNTTDSNEAIKDAVGIGSGSPYVVKVEFDATEYDKFSEAIIIYTGTTPELIFTVTKDGSPVDLSGKTPYLIIKKTDKTLLSNAIVNKAGTVSGDDNNICTFSLSLEETQALTGKEGDYKGQIDIGPNESVTRKFPVLIERKLRQ